MKKILLATFVALWAFTSMPSQAAPAPVNNSQPIEIVEENVTNEVILADEAAGSSNDVAANSAASNHKLTPEERNSRIREADSSGIGITLMSMAIVICSLIVLSLLFLAFGKISQSMHTKKKLKNYGLEHDVDNHEAYSGEACAAIAAALHQYFNDRHDLEDHVLTMRKLKRAYSPWSSKLYGLRQMPERNNWHR